MIAIGASCYERYDADIVSDETVLVVEGMVTNEPDFYPIRLSLAAPYDSGNNRIPVNSAHVYVTDDQGNSFTFTEREIGEYLSEKSEFLGLSGHTYILHIVMPDGEEYESDPQKLPTMVYPDSVYAEFAYQETIDQTTGLEVIRPGAIILADIEPVPETFPYYRFTSALTTQYFYIFCITMVKCWSFHCWRTDNANSGLSLTGGDYSLNSSSIEKHAVCFVEKTELIFGSVYELLAREPFMRDTALLTDKYQNYNVHNSIVFLNQYTLNEETYSYYKAVDEQISSEGKLFDPITAQLMGNIKCKTDPGKKVLGFFETSAVSHTAYKVDFKHLINDQPTLTKVPYILPPLESGCLLDTPPDFWVF